MNMNFDTNSRFFQYRNEQLFAESTDLKELAETYGTPLYVYSKSEILDSFDSYEKGLNEVPHLLAFAVKANGNLAILNLFAQRNAGADLTSGGEMQLALRSGISPDRMVFSGVGKTKEEIRDALEAGILMFNVESQPELEMIEKIAQDSGKKAPIAVRVNPNIDAKTHPKITTGLREHKFGVPLEQSLLLYQQASSSPHLTIQGIAAHIGSSLSDTMPLLEALQCLLDLRQQLQDIRVDISYIDIGGGLGIKYNQESPETPEEYGKKLARVMQAAKCTLIVEPGRSIVGNAGILLCKVLYVKKSAHRTWVVVDAGMNDLARPAIYGAYHRIVPVTPSENHTETVDVVGPICESSDVFGKQVSLPPCKPGDILSVCSAGAYGFAMSSHYNGRLRPAEVMVENDQDRLIRKRETYEDLWRHQVQ